MASSLEINAELEIYFRDNWTSTPLELPTFPFDKDGLTEWIFIVYEAKDNTIMGCNGTSTGRLNYMGIFSVFCFSTNRMKVNQVADNVSTFLNGKSLPKNIEVGIGKHGKIIDTDDNNYYMEVKFEVNQN